MMWLHLGVAAMFGNSIPYLLFAVAGMLNAPPRLWTLAIALAAGQHHRPTPARLAGLGLGLAGTVLIFVP